ncbi:MAG: xanthine phosphoribosyltransferase [Gemella sp.]|nr:xanthine phosphoribosyltransferase [Gemella sp.]
MKLLEKMVENDGKVYPNNVLKVDSFINHQIDPNLMQEIAKSLSTYFSGKEITKIMTIESSGIAPALMLSSILKVPMVFAKKTKPATLTADSFYNTQIHSYTKSITNTVIVSKEFLNSDDKILLVDDFLANGQAILGLADLIEQADADLVGVGIIIEKSFQDGRKLIEEKGIDICSLCRISSLDGGKVVFIKADDEK